MRPRLTLEIGPDPDACTLVIRLPVSWPTIYRTWSKIGADIKKHKDLLALAKAERKERAS